MNIISKNSKQKIIIKRSQFIGFSFYIKSEEEVKPIILQIKKEYKAANHVAYAYKVSTINNQFKEETKERYDDAGEPSKTAGFPIKQVIEQNKLTNILIVVARIFGGIKLGTPGLFKAYGQCAKKTLEHVKINKEDLTYEKIIIVPLNKFNLIEIFLKKNKIKFNSEFYENVKIRIDIPIHKKQIEKEINLFLNNIL